MKTKLLLLLFAGLQLCLFSCKKNNIKVCCTANPPATSIFNKWHIVSDSTFAGVGVTNHPVDYAGQTGDYFDVRTNNIIYTREGNVLDTLTYSALTDSTIVISSFGITLNGVPQKSHLINFTAHSLTIKAPLVITPGGEFGRTTTLTR